MEKKFENTRRNIFIIGGSASLGRDDLNRVHHGKYLHCTISKGEAQREVLRIHHRSIFSILDRCLKGGK